MLYDLLNSDISKRKDNAYLMLADAQESSFPNRMLIPATVLTRAERARAGRTNLTIVMRPSRRRGSFNSEPTSSDNKQSYIPPELLNPSCITAHQEQVQANRAHVVENEEINLREHHEPADRRDSGYVQCANGHRHVRSEERARDVPPVMDPAGDITLPCQLMS